jgi:hypothetical protein
MDAGANHRRSEEEEVKMTWRVANSLIHLREQINAKWPHRSKASDGTIGNAEHQTRDSDHNPWVRDGKQGVVTALDITNDPINGVVSEEIAEAIRLSHDPRVKYIISNKKIAASYNVHGEKAWEWRPYFGANPHNHHCHISVVSEKLKYDSVVDWKFQKGDK